jgi:hypothetical protein
VVSSNAKENFEELRYFFSGALDSANALISGDGGHCGSVAGPRDQSMPNLWPFAH